MKGIWAVSVIVSILIFSIFGFANLMQNSFSEHPPANDFITKSLTGGTMATIDYRDITNTSPQFATLSIDPTSPSLGDTVTVTVEEQAGNVDILDLDILLSRASSTTSGLATATVLMTETGVNTGTFSGPLILSSSATTGNNLEVAPDDLLSISYKLESNGVGQLQLNLNVATSGDVQISDELINLNVFLINQNFRPVTHPIQVVLQNGATLNDNAIVTISYAYAVLQIDDFGNESLLNMYFKRDDIVIPGIGTFPFGWEKIRDQTAADPNSHDANAKTITSDLANTNFGNLGNTILFGTFFGQPLTGGQFLLGLEQGVGGGGGGGLVIPGLEIILLTVIQGQPAPQTPSELIDFIDELGLPSNVENNLRAPLKQAQDVLDDDNPKNDAAVCGKITAFLNEIDAKERNGQLTSEQANQLRDAAQAVIEELGCE